MEFRRRLSDIETMQHPNVGHDFAIYDTSREAHRGVPVRTGENWGSTELIVATLYESPTAARSPQRVGGLFLLAGVA
jgi:hypothetical protein